MKRRESLKVMLVGSIGAATVAATSACKPDPTTNDLAEDAASKLYGRTPLEIEHDEKVKATIFLNDHELETIAVLCDIILPATKDAGSATDAKVPEFIDFIVKDIPKHQLPIRGGLMWLDAEANRRFDKEFIACSPDEEIQLIDDIAYPDPGDKKPAMAPGIKFFSLMRNLTVTGYYTTKMGFDDLKVNSNFPNVWDGVPAEILTEHDVDYDPEWLAKCVDQNERTVIAKWDEDGNLLT